MITMITFDSYGQTPQHAYRSHLSDMCERPKLAYFLRVRVVGFL